MSVAVLELERKSAAGEEGRVAVLWLARPDARNALDAALVDALVDALGACADDAGVGSVVLAGRGPVFCAGGDLKGAMQGQGGFLAAHAARGRYAALLQAIGRCPVPVVAAVHGAALGGGLGLAAACDIVIAERSASFGTPELGIGLFPWIIAAVLQRDVPRKRLAELIYTAGRWSADEAWQAGLVSRVVDDGAALEQAITVAARAASFSPAVVAMGKAALARVHDQPLDDALAYMQTQLSLNLLTEDAMEGIAAFHQRRSPTWKGR